jgi:hypothetical protein
LRKSSLKEGNKVAPTQIEPIEAQMSGELEMESVTCLVKKEGNQYVSLCVELDVASCRRTQKEAVGGLRNAREAYLEYMLSVRLDGYIPHR